MTACYFEVFIYEVPGSDERREGDSMRYKNERRITTKYDNMYHKNYKHSIIVLLRSLH